MTRKRALLIGLCALLLLGISSWCYWEMELPLQAQIPNAQWTKLGISVGELGVGDSEIAPPALEAVLGAIRDTRVTRRTEIYGLTYPYFRLVLYKGKAYPTLIYIQENGWITIAKELDFDNYCYYEGGEALYQALLELTSNTSAAS